MKRGNGEPTHAYAAGLLLFDQPCLLENAQVLKNGWHRDVVGTGEFGYGGMPTLEGGEDGPARGVAEGTEGRVEIRLILNHTVMY